LCRRRCRKDDRDDGARRPGPRSRDEVHLVYYKLDDVGVRLAPYRKPHRPQIQLDYSQGGAATAIKAE
jgi:hypothetical protein